MVSIRACFVSRGRVSGVITSMLRVILKPSAYLATALAAVHVAAAATLLPLDLPAWAKLALAITIAASLANALWRHAFLKARYALTGIELGEADRASVETRDGRWHDARVLPTTYVSPLLSVLNVRLEDRMFTRHMLIVADNVDADDFRRLRVRLRWGYRTDAQ